MIEYYGRDIGVKIMPTGVNPDRFLSGFEWEDTIWRRGELLTQVLLETNSLHIKHKLIGCLARLSVTTLVCSTLTSAYSVQHAGVQTLSCASAMHIELLLLLAMPAVCRANSPHGCG